jgi:hypothetical protein
MVVVHLRRGEVVADRAARRPLTEPYARLNATVRQGFPGLVHVIAVSRTLRT